LVANAPAFDFLAAFATIACVSTDGATIEYATAVGDIVAFNQFHMRVSPTGKRTLVRLAVSAGVLTFLGSVGLIAVLNAFVFAKQPIGLVITLPCALVGAAVVAARARGMLDRSVARSVTRMLAEGQNKSLLGWHRLALGERAVRSESEVSSSEVSYGALERVDETPAHVFVYTGATSAFVVPKAAVSAGELGPFVEELRRRIADAGDKR
jgi:hypothetical protein